ncbi:glycerophosphodiester phosphodiesterase [Pseudidiomarina aestuarii]|uniref:glycerophosphodiester phosphodiesterase n=1 Tax=Pseudidiomarina aestuarii TaxID=624146 RepID=UPI003A97D397
MAKWVLIGYTLLMMLTEVAAAQQLQPLMIAHRGASGYAPEHTATAVALAHGMNADYIEQDVVLSRDHVPVVLHDLKLDAVTNVATVFPDRKRPDGSYYVLDFTFAELQQLTVKERFDPATQQRVYPQRFPHIGSSHRIMSLAQQLELIRGLNVSRNKNIGVYIETKASRWHRQHNYDVVAAVVKVLNKYGYLEPVPPTPVYLQSFEPEDLRRLQREFYVELPLVQLVAENSWNESPTDYAPMRTAAGLESLSTHIDGVGVWLGHVVKGVTDEGLIELTDLIQDAHAADLKVHVYTLRRDALPKGVTDYQLLLDTLAAEGVDGLFSDFPDLRPSMTIASDTHPSHHRSSPAADQ